MPAKTSHRAVLRLILPLCVVALGACSASVSTTKTVSAGELASRVKSTLTGSDTSKAKVTCAGSLAAKVGATQNCDVTGGGGRTGLHLKVDKVDGGKIHWTQRPFIHGSDLAATIAKATGASPSDLSCPDINGVVGTAVTCKVNKGTATAVDVTVTSVHGLHIGIKYKAH